MPSIWYPKQGSCKTKPPAKEAAAIHRNIAKLDAITSGPPSRRSETNANYRLARAREVWDVQARAVSGRQPESKSQVQGSEMVRPWQGSLPGPQANHLGSTRGREFSLF